MTRWLAAARQAERAGTQLTKPTKPRPREVLSVLSVLSDGAEAKPAPPLRPAEAAPRTASVVTPETFPHGLSVAGNPLTWTGRVVSLDAWRQLSE